MPSIIDTKDNILQIKWYDHDSKPEVTGQDYPPLRTSSPAVTVRPKGLFGHVAQLDSGVLPY